MQASLEKDVIIPHTHLVQWLPDDQVGMATSGDFLKKADTLLYFAGVLDRKVTSADPAYLFCLSRCFERPQLI